MPTVPQSFISSKLNERPTTLEEARARREHYESITRELDWQDKPSSGGYSTNEMHVVFMKVRNPKHWKLAIDWKGELTEEERLILERAIPEFTGGGASFVPDRMAGDNVWRVKAPGYYACIGA